MSKGFQNEPTDEQLDALLRDVEVPKDLKAQLNRIAGSNLPEQPTELAHQATANVAYQQAAWHTYALVAGILGVVAFASAIWLQNNLSDGQFIANDAKTPNAHESDSVANSNSYADVAYGIDAQQALLEAKLQELEIAGLQLKLSKLEQKNSGSLADHEIESIIMALAPELSISLDESESYFKAELARVVDQYPNTRGADLARQSLIQTN